MFQPSEARTTVGPNAPVEKGFARLTTWLFLPLGVLSVLLNSFALWLLLLNRGTPIGEGYGPRGFQLPFSLVFILVGTLIVIHRVRNTIGWIFSGVGFLAAFQVFMVEYGVYTLFTRPAPLPFGMVAVWLQYWIWIIMVCPLIAFTPLLFPEGQLPSSRWRPVAWIAAASILLAAVSFAVLPGPIGEEFETVPNPFALEGHGEVLLALFISGIVVTLVIGLIATISLLQRLRRSRGVERQQYKWFAYAAALSVTASLFSADLSYGARLAIVGWLALPLSIGIAILRYRLYDIDLIINKTLVYVLLTGCLGLVYLSSVLVMQQLFQLLTGQGSQVAIIASTLTIAAVFNPLRQRIQAFIDYRFYRSKYDARQVLAAFTASTRSASSADLDYLTGELVHVIEATIQPTWLSIWLREEPGTAQAGSEGLVAKV